MSEERLWAPWRLEYVKSEKPSSADRATCLFCAKSAEDSDRENYIVYRGDKSFVILNAYPYNNGHLMIAPYDHLATISDIDDETALEIMDLSRKATQALDQIYHPEGYNIGINQGKVAGAGVEHHIHMHIVPRWGADTNFMPVIADTRVLPQSLEASYDQLEGKFD